VGAAGAGRNPTLAQARVAEVKDVVHPAVAGVDIGRKVALVGIRVHDQVDTQLPHIVDAGDVTGFLAGLGQGREKHGGQNGDDGNDDQQLDQGEAEDFLALHG